MRVSALVLGGAFLVGVTGAKPVLAADDIHAWSLEEIVNQTMGLSDSDLVHIDYEPTPGVPQMTSIELDGERYTLDLTPFSVRASGYKVFHSGAGGRLTEVEPGPISTMRGVALEAPGSFVAASLLSDGLYGRIIIADDREYWFEPIARHVNEDTAGIHVVYQDEDILPHDGTCAVTAEPGAQAMGAGLGMGSFQPGPMAASGGQTFRTALGCDADNRYFDRWGNNTESRVNAVIDQMNVQYERDVDITHVISAVVIRTEQVYTTNSSEGLLDQFRSRWLGNHRDIDRATAHLFTGRNLSGNVIGIAYLSVICDNPITGAGFGLVQSDFNNNFSCATDLSAHELGHNWSAGHCNCSGFTMNPSITCANRFSSGSINAIINHRNTRQCLDGSPLNDDCVDADAIGNGSYPYVTHGATTDGPRAPDSCDDGSGTRIRNDIWYVYTAECTGTATANACDADYDNRMVIYADVTCPGDVVVGCSDNACGSGGTRAEATFQVVEGRQYRIQLGGSSAEGTGTLVLSCEEGPVCLEDFDGNGEVDFGDLLELLSHWGPCGEFCPWDLNDDGEVGFADLVQVLAAWGPC